jgi:uncharacterized spore protein YtfJ
MDDLDRGIGQAEGSVSGGMGDVVARLADRVGSRAGARAVFGDPVERDGATVIPVARVRWGFGGGGGRGGRAQEEGEGSGGGGTVSTSPVGYIELSGGGVQFKRIGFPVPPETMITGAIAFYLLMRGLRILWR